MYQVCMFRLHFIGTIVHNGTSAHAYRAVQVEPSGGIVLRKVLGCDNVQVY